VVGPLVVMVTLKTNDVRAATKPVDDRPGRDAHRYACYNTCRNRDDGHKREIPRCVGSSRGYLAIGSGVLRTFDLPPGLTGSGGMDGNNAADSQSPIKENVIPGPNRQLAESAIGVTIGVVEVGLDSGAGVSVGIEGCDVGVSDGIKSVTGAKNRLKEVGRSWFEATWTG